jgi:hypothetical protein
MMFDMFSGMTAPYKITADRSKRLKFRLYLDTNFVIINDNYTCSATLYDRNTNKIIGTIYDSSDKYSNKHFKSFMYELLAIESVNVESKVRFVQALFILDPYCYRKTKYELYDYLVNVLNELCREAIYTGINPYATFDEAIILNKAVEEYYKMSRHWPCDDSDMMDNDAIDHNCT